MLNVTTLILALFIIAPRTAALISNGPIYGTVLCKSFPFYSYYFSAAGVFQMCAMTTCKVATLQYPLRTNSLSSKHAQKGCLVIWLSLLSLPALSLLNSETVFDYRVYSCEMTFKAAIWTWLKPLLTTIYTVIPNVLVTASTVRLLFMAKQAAARRNKNVNLQGVIATILVAVVYHVSLLPLAVYYIAESRVADKTNFFQKEYYRMSLSFLYFNIISNFFIYSFTIGSFRQFLCRLVQRKSRTFPANRTHDDEDG